MKYILLTMLMLSLVTPVHAEAWPDGPYPNRSTYWENKGASMLVVQDAWKTADIIGFDEVQSEVESLRSENISLRNQIQRFESRLQSLELDLAPSVVNTTVVQQADMSRVSALEKEMKIQQMVISMMEVNIGSLYARMDQLFAPILKKLGL